MRGLARDILDGEGAPAPPQAPRPRPARGGPRTTNNPEPAPLRARERLRQRLKLSQDDFARRYGIPVGTLRDWEQARRAPDACGRAYLAVIARAPEIVPEVLSGRYGGWRPRAGVVGTRDAS